MKKILTLISIFFVCHFNTATAAADAKYTESEKSAIEVVETPIKVLQNRYFLKGMRPEVSLFAGSVLNEPYIKTIGLGARAGLFVTETYGLEYSFRKFWSEDSADLKALKNIEYCIANVCKRPEPSFSKLLSLHAVTATVAPIYGKINLFEQYILYSDIYFNVGLGKLKFKIEPESNSERNKIAGVIAVGQRFYFAKSFNIRLDAEDIIFKEDRFGIDGSSSSSTKHSWKVSAGVSFFVLANN